MAKPFEPGGLGRRVDAVARRAAALRGGLLAVERLELASDTRSMSPPMLPSLNVSAIHGSNCVMTRGFTSGCVAR